MEQADFGSPQAVAMGGEEQRPIALALDDGKQPPDFIGSQKFDGGQAHGPDAWRHGKGLPPADQLKDGDDDVAGAAEQAADNPVAGVLLRGRSERLAAVGTVVGHGRGDYCSKEFI